MVTAIVLQTFCNFLLAFALRVLVYSVQYDQESFDFNNEVWEEKGFLFRDDGVWKYWGTERSWVKIREGRGVLFRQTLRCLLAILAIACSLLHCALLNSSVRCNAIESGLISWDNCGGREVFI